MQCLRRLRGSSPTRQLPSSPTPVLCPFAPALTFAPLATRHSPLVSRSMSRLTTRAALAIALAALFATATPAGAQDPLEITPFKPFRVADNLYFVGTEGLGMFLVATPQGHILVNTG